LATLNVTYGNIESALNQAQTELKTTIINETQPKTQTKQPQDEHKKNFSQLTLKDQGKITQKTSYNNNIHVHV
jgi:hypothetical protein